ncbi:hypothetical protein GGR53DRAFT_483080 [Hypoxylon sp. FL1150]|nr:hypothetical protein GGR53DRAFT_483080 [Hypoxylon sp. FL1150]
MGAVNVNRALFDIPRCPRSNFLGPLCVVNSNILHIQSFPLKQLITAMKMKQDLMKCISSSMLTHSLFITTVTSLVVLASTLIIADPLQLRSAKKVQGESEEPTAREHAHAKSIKEVQKTWRLFIVPESGMATCSLNHDSLKSALESKFEISLKESRLVLSPEPDQYCATISLRGVRSPFTSHYSFELYINTAEDQKTLVKYGDHDHGGSPHDLLRYTVTPDEDFLHMTTLYDGTIGKENVVDLIVVPGLSSHPYGSFKSPQDATENWLRDYLPQKLPDIRIMVYGYNSALLGGKGKETIQHYATGLLDAIRLYRKDTKAPCIEQHRSERPIIFVAHSLGGLVVKQALVDAKDSNTGKDQKLLMSCYGLLFFGVPNRGLRHEELKAISGNSPIGQLVYDLVVDDDTEVKPYLRTLGQNFRKVFENKRLDIAAFYEGKTSPTVMRDEGNSGKWTRSGKNKLMVTQDSAIMVDGCRVTENIVPLAADHSNMVKFSTEHDSLYRPVQQKISDMVEEAPGVIKALFNSINGV